MEYAKRNDVLLMRSALVGMLQPVQERVERDAGQKYRAMPMRNQPAGDGDDLAVRANVGHAHATARRELALNPRLGCRHVRVPR